MKIYFLSAQPCALTLNGVFFGLTDRFERSAEIALSDKIYVQFSPEGALPIGFFITEELPTTPPVGCEVYLVKEGLAIYAYDFPPADFTLKAIAQAREGDTLATLFLQGKLQLSIESPLGFFNATLPPSLVDCTLSFHGDFVLVKGAELLGIYSKRGERLFLERILEYELDADVLIATLPLSDSRNRIAKCRWQIAESGCTLTEFTLQQATDEKATPEGLIAYAFFESVLLRGDYAAFLSDELKADAENIRAFLGDFLSVVLTEEETTCGLVRKKGERLFAVEYFSVEIEKGKIVDVRG